MKDTILISDCQNDNKCCFETMIRLTETINNLYYLSDDTYFNAFNLCRSTKELIDAMGFNFEKTAEKLEAIRSLILGDVASWGKVIEILKKDLEVENE